MRREILLRFRSLQGKLETKKRKRKNEVSVEKTVVTGAGRKGGKIAKVQYYKKVVYDGGEFEVGNDVYVKREDATSEEDPELEECRFFFFRFGDEIMTVVRSITVRFGSIFGIKKNV
ncbi:hypothetical protein MtrunA17_Chr3g0102561 [Medicago truncatula]|uniref:Uncharacterized protein n=1 Tax=Medicago truncatula TaxID=3880 RepID=A0A396IPB3_MEDTR|nr:hypothetical protein MtrunA17_Chr3g0102561 [Medicago truncatula]